MDKYFKILNVNKDMSLSEIKSAYRKLLKKYHPDTYLGDKAFAEKKTIEINEAYSEIVKYKNNNSAETSSKSEKTQKTQKSEQHSEHRKQWNYQASNQKQDFSNLNSKSKTSFSNKNNNANTNFSTKKKNEKIKKEEKSTFNGIKIENSAEKIDEFLKTEEEIKREKTGKRILDAIIISLSVITIGLILLFIFMGKSFWKNFEVWYIVIDLKRGVILLYNKNEEAVIFFSSFELSYKKQECLFSLCENICDLVENFNDYSENIKEIVADEKVYSDICYKISTNFITSYLKNLENKNIICVTYISDSYPDSLREIEQPPFILFCKGDISLLNSEAIAVVGTRTPTSYGKNVTEQFVKGLVLNNFTIISGLATGVDSIAHRTTLENSGKTIAVLGGGFDHIYPAFNFDLSKQIENSGLLVSEYAPQVKPALYTFPFRNRIISGLSKGVLITEAGEKSGALHTKEFALESGKDVFAVPGNINSSMSKGTNKLIRCLQGACVLSFEDIVNRYREDVIKEKKVLKQQMSFEEQLILDALKLEKKSIDELLDLTKLDIAKLNSCLTLFEIKGIITKLPGNYIELIK